jgi:hypothetical protein
VELLERVVRQHRRPGAIRDLEDEAVAASNRSCRRHDELVRGERFVVQLSLGRIDAMFERRVDDDGVDVVRSLRDECTHSFVELRE